MEQEVIQKIDVLLQKIGKNYAWLIAMLQNYSSQQDKRKQALKKYYLNNKERLKDYHKQYRATHPEYRQKAKERSKRAREK